MSEEVKQEPAEGSQTAADVVKEAINPSPTTTQEAGAPAISETEQAARAKGWLPKEEYAGDAWIGAAEFMGRQPLYDGLQQQGKQLRELRSTVTKLADHNSKVEKAGYDRAVRDLSAKKLEAYEGGDFKTVVEVEGQERELAQAKLRHDAQARVAAPDPSEFAAWRTNNPWYGNDANMTHWADGYGKHLMDTRPGIVPTDVFNEVARKVAEVFPNKNRMPNRGHPSTKAGTASKKSASAADLTPEEREVCNTFVKQGVMTEEEYVTQLAKTKP